MAGSQLFECAIIKQELRDSVAGNVVEKAEIIVGLKSVLCQNSDQAKALISREIPEAELENMDRLVILARPFRIYE